MNEPDIHLKKFQKADKDAGAPAGGPPPGMGGMGGMPRGRSTPLSARRR